MGSGDIMMKHGEMFYIGFVLFFFAVFVVGFVAGKGWDKWKRDILQKRLNVAEAALIQKQGQLNLIYREIKEGRWVSALS